MSSVARTVKTAFKKVVKTVKKVLPYVALAAATVFTAGVALAAIAPAAATGIFGWSTLLKGLIGSTMSTTLGSIVSGAVTQGIVGTAIGGITAAATGGDITKGMLVGGIGGAIVGGVTGAINVPAVPGVSSEVGRTVTGAGAAGEVLEAGAIRTGTDQLVGGAARDRLGTSFLNAQPAGVADFLSSGPQTAESAARLGLLPPAGSPIVNQAAITPRVSGKAAQPVPSASVATAASAATPVQKPWSELTALEKLGRVAGSKTAAAVAGGAATALLSGGEGREEAARIDAESRRLDRATTAANFETGRRGLLTGAPGTVARPQRWAWNPATRRIELAAA